MKLIVFILIVLLTPIFYPFRVLASELKFDCPNRYLVLINPIRSRNHWGDKSLRPLEDQYKAINSKKFPATWLIQYDAMSDPELLNYLKGFEKSQELGIFLEVSENLAEESRVIYPFETSWYFPQAVFLSGYSQSERIKLIDTAIDKFKKDFGYYPKSLGSWWIDSYSLNYLKNKYGIESYLIVADQKTTDNYGIWGQWWGVPYYPDKANVLFPGQGKDKLDLIVLQWAQRHPELAVGEGVKFSNNSVQPNDYLSLGKDTNFFKDLVQIYLDCKNPFGQLTIGMETGAVSTNFNEEYINQLEVLSRIKELKAVTMSGFYREFKKTFPENPEKIIIAGKNSEWSLSLQKRENKVIGELINYRQGSAFSDYFIPDKSGFLEKDLTRYKVRANPQNELLNFLPLILIILAGVVSVFWKKALFWLLSTGLIFSSFGLLLRSGYELGWNVYYGIVVSNLLLVQIASITFVYILALLAYKYIRYLRSYWLWVWISFSYGFDFIIGILRVSFISEKYYIGILVDAYRFFGIRGNVAKGVEIVNEDLPNYLASGLLNFDTTKIYENLYLYFLAAPLIHILVGILLFKIYSRIPKIAKRILFALLLIFYILYLVNIFKADPRVVLLNN